VRALEWLGEAAHPWAVERIHRTPLFFLGADFDRRDSSADRADAERLQDSVGAVFATKPRY